MSIDNKYYNGVKLDIDPMSMEEFMTSETTITENGVHDVRRYTKAIVDVEGGGTSYIAGDGILISNKVISVDNSVVATKDYTDDQAERVETSAHSYTDLLFNKVNITVKSQLEGNSVALDNVFYNLEPSDDLTITLEENTTVAEAGTANVYRHWLIQFNSGENLRISLPTHMPAAPGQTQGQPIYWQSMPDSLEDNTIYQISIVNGCGVICSFT